MSVTSSPEPMELETGPTPSLLTGDVAAEWPIQEDPDIILRRFSYSHSDFSEQVQIERDQTRTKLLALTSEEQLTIGENIRPHPAHSDEVLFTQTISLKSQSPSLPSSTSYLLTSPRRVFTSLPSQHRDTPSLAEPTDRVKTNSSHKNTFFNSSSDPAQHTDPDGDQNPEISSTNSNPDLSLDLKNTLNNKTAEPQTECERVRSTDILLPDEPVDSEQLSVCRRLPSPVITNGTQHDVPSDGSSQLRDTFKHPSIDTPPLSSTTPEDLISDPFSSLSSDHANGSTQSTTQVQESESEGNQVGTNEGDNSLKQSQVEIENKNPNYELETPPDDTIDPQLPNPSAEDYANLSSPRADDDDEVQLSTPCVQNETQLLSPTAENNPQPRPPCVQNDVQLSSPTQNDVQLSSPCADNVVQMLGVDGCSSLCQFHDYKDIVVTEYMSPTQMPVESEHDIEQGLTIVTEIETFSTIPPDSHKDDITNKESPASSIRLPPHLQTLIDNPKQDLTIRLHLKKYEHIISMQHTLEERSRELKENISQMEEKILVQQSKALFSATQDKPLSDCSRVPPLTHSHLLKQTHTREIEKQARSLISSLNNCKSRMKTGFETESSSEDECYLNSTNLGGPKRRRLTKLHRNWLSDRAQIGGRWNWLDLQLAQIDSEIRLVNQRIDEIARSTQKESLLLDTSSRCSPYTPSTSRVIRQSVSGKLGTLNNILQSTPHYHSILSLRDDIPSTLLMYDSMMGLSTKDLPLDSKDIRKLELAITHNKSSPAQQGRYKAIRGMSKKIGHRPKLNSQTQSSRYRHVSEMSQYKPGKSKSPLSGGSRQRRPRSYDTTSIIIPGSYLPKPEKPNFKEIVIPGWRPAECSHQVDTDAMNIEDTADSSYEAMHSKCEELEIRNYQDALHYSTSSKKLKRHQVNPDTQRLSISSYGWTSRRFPLSSEDCFDEMTSHLSELMDPTSPIENAVFSTPHTTSDSFKSQQ